MNSWCFFQVRKLHELCKIGGGGDLVARVYPSLTKLFQRCCASVVSSQRSSTGLLLLVRVYFLSLICYPNHDQKLASVCDFQLTLLRRCCCSSVSNLSLSLVGMLWHLSRPYCNFFWISVNLYCMMAILACEPSFAPSWAGVLLSDPNLHWIRVEKSLTLDVLII